MNIRLKYFLIGAAFGMLFPLGALVMELQRFSLSLNIDSLHSVHATNPILYMIDSAPLFLGLFALIGGISKEKSVQLIGQFREVGDFLFQNTEILKNQSEQSLTSYVDSIRRLSTDFTSIDELNRFTFTEITTSLEGTNRVGTEIDRMKVSLDEIKNYNHDVGDNHKQIKHHLLLYMEKIHSLKDYFEYLNDFSREIELLAVNSAIEANKHGAQGKAFLVFSQNIQRLAKNTKQRNDEVLKMMDMVSSETGRLGEIFDRERENIQQIIHLAEQVNNATTEFEGVIREFVDNLQEASEHLNQQNALTSSFGSTLKTIGGSNREIVERLKEVVNHQINLVQRMEQVT